MSTIAIFVVAIVVFILVALVYSAYDEMRSWRP